MKNEKLRASSGRSSTAKGDILPRTYRFSLDAMHLCDHLNVTPGLGWQLSRQLFRAATSVGANLEEAQAGQSRADFACKCTIALKEARETGYWLRLLRDSKKFPNLEDESVALLKEANELARILGAIIVSTRRNTGN